MIEDINDIIYGVNKRYQLFSTERQLTHFSISTNPKRMGRPPLNNKPILVRLPEDAVNKIDELVGTYGRAKFIREAVEAELERRSNSDAESQD